jgi:hypothetical protein
MQSRQQVRGVLVDHQRHDDERERDQREEIQQHEPIVGGVLSCAREEERPATAPPVAMVHGVDGGLIWSVLVAANLVVYVAFIRRRDEGSLLWSVALAVLLGPLCWFAWLAMRSARRRAEQ